MNRDNTSFEVGAGGFEAVTNPTVVFTVKDSGRGAVSAKDVNVLDNALGYVLSQGGTVHFSPDDPDAYDFPLEYAVVSFAPKPDGSSGKAFFDYLGTIDPALWERRHSRASPRSTIPCSSFSRTCPDASSWPDCSGPPRPIPGPRTRRSTTAVVRRRRPPASRFPATTGFALQRATSI